MLHSELRTQKINYQSNHPSIQLFIAFITVERSQLGCHPFSFEVCGGYVWLVCWWKSSPPRNKTSLCQLASARESNLFSLDTIYLRLESNMKCMSSRRCGSFDFSTHCHGFFLYVRIQHLSWMEGATINNSLLIWHMMVEWKHLVVGICNNRYLHFFWKYVTLINTYIFGALHMLILIWVKK